MRRPAAWHRPCGGSSVGESRRQLGFRSPGSLREAEQILIASFLIRLIHLFSLYKEIYLIPKQKFLIR